MLEELCSLGSDPNYVCSKPAAKTNEANGSTANDIGRTNNTPVGNEVGSSDEEEEEEDDGTTAATLAIKAASTDAKTPVPLVDYILNVVCFEKDRCVKSISIDYN